jgi:cytochrome c-type biogenesis protein CcmH
MLVFWLIAFALIGIVLAMILPSLLKPSTVLKTDTNAEKRAIFRQQFDEIEQDRLNGVLDNDQYAVAKSELERRLLDEVGVKQVDAVSSVKVLPDRRLATILMLLLPILAVFIYLKIGSPDSVTIPVLAPNTVKDIASSQQTLDHNKMAGDIEPLLEKLKAKLEKDPGDGSGWALLARSYVELRRHADAVPIYEKAVKAIPDDPQLLADYADALAVVNGRSLAGKPEELAIQALKLDPHHTKALLLAATAAFDRKDYKQAITYWERLQQDLPTDSDILPDVKAALSEAYTASGIKPTLQPAKPVASSSDITSNTGISGTVTIAPTLASKLDTNATVFVFARATQGMPMPLAIVRTTAKELPYSYHLDDSSALMPGNKLSLAKEVVVVARISKTGDAKPQTGDMQGVSMATKPVGDRVDIQINELVP